MISLLILIINLHPMSSTFMSTHLIELHILMIPRHQQQ